MPSVFSRMGLNFFRQGHFTCTPRMNQVSQNCGLPPSRAVDSTQQVNTVHRRPGSQVARAVQHGMTDKPGQ